MEKSKIINTFASNNQYEKFNNNTFSVAITAIATTQGYQPTSNGEVVQHSYYSLSYIEEHEQSEWVYYSLTPDMVTGEAERASSFKLDPKVSTKSASTSDYTKSGYDRGHLCPAADMSFSDVAMKESFYMSNVSPQLPSFNRGGWKILEEQVRKWAASTDTLHVVVGAILKSDLEFATIGTNKVSVPTHYYKIIYSPQNQRMSAFVMPNAKLESPIDSYATSVDYIELMTAIDFFPQLDDVIEEGLEAAIFATPLQNMK